MIHTEKHLSIAYVMQNTGVDLTSDVGAPILVKYTLHGLQKAGHQVGLLALNGRSVNFTDDVSDLENLWHAPLGLTGKRPFLFLESGVRRLQSELGLPYFALFDTCRFYEACYRCLPGYSLCHEYHGLFSLGAALACSRLKVPYVLTVDADLLLENAVVGKPLRGLHAVVAAWGAKMTFRLARRIICVSEAAKQHFVHNYHIDPEKIAVLPNGVDVDRFGRHQDPGIIRAKMGLDNAPIIMFVGGFQLWHGLDKLVESFAQVVDAVPETRLLLVGDGPARPIVERKCAELGVTDMVIITGLMPQGHVPEMLAVADVAVIPYPHLPKDLWFSPLKLYEYMGAGKAIVASRAGQIAEVIQDRYNGLLVEPGDVNGFAEAIIMLLKNPPERERLGQNARRQAVERHSWDQCIQRLEEIYLSVL
jgi:glycosyltransferase involved in cell wall biosynthesis